MFRTIFLSAIAVVAMATPLAFTSQADARERFNPEISRHRHYTVYYRSDCCCEWRCYGTYHCDCEAHDAVRYLRRRGYDAYVNHG